MAENELNGLVDTILDEKQPPGANADKLMEEAVRQGVSDFQTAPDAPFPPGPASASNPEGFDPLLHEADAQGNPVLNTDGTLRKRRGRKPGRDAAGHFVRSPDPVSPAPAISPAATSFAAVPAEPPKEITREACKISAQQTVGVAIAMAVGVFGDEWNPEPANLHPMGIDEAGSLTDALTEYYFAQQFSGLSPGWIVLLAAGTYAGRRVQKPKTKEVFKKWWGKVRRFLPFISR